MTAQEAMDKLGEWREKWGVHIYAEPDGWELEVDRWGSDDPHTDLTDAVAEVDAKIKADLG